MLYVQLDTNWPDNPKIIRAGIEAAGLHAVALCLAKRLESDGWIDRAVLRRQGATDELIGLCVEHRLLEDGGDRVRPWGWLDRNPSQAAIAATRRSKALAGKRGNHVKWGHAGPLEECAACFPNPQVIAGCDPTDSQTIAVDEPCDSVATKAEVEGEVTRPIAAAIANDHPGVVKLPAEQVANNVSSIRALRVNHREGA